MGGTSQSVCGVCFVWYAFFTIKKCTSTEFRNGAPQIISLPYIKLSIIATYFFIDTAYLN